MKAVGETWMRRIRLYTHFLVGLSLISFVCLICPVAYGAPAWSAVQASRCPTAHNGPTPASENSAQYCALMQAGTERTGLLERSAPADIKSFTLEGPVRSDTLHQPETDPFLQNERDLFAKSHPQELYLLNRTLLL